MVGPQDDDGWFATNLQHLSDMVVVARNDTTVVWGNEAITRTLGWAIDDLVGRSFAEFLHPDDLERAAEVASLVDQGVFHETEVRPALYRVKHRDGRWVSVELNASLRSSDDGHFVVVCRFTGDLVHGTELLEVVTSGRPLREQIGVTLELGRWRYPDEGYVIVYRDAGGYAALAGPGVDPVLVGPESPLGDLPWRRAVEAGGPIEISDLTDPASRAGLVSDELAAAAIDAGYAGALAVPVEDPGYGEPAAIMVWSRYPGESLVGHRYAVSTMIQALRLVFLQRAQRLRLEQAAYVDQLTGVLSRRRFLELLSAADPEPPATVAHVVLYIDLDDFKQVNDRHGHGIGDHVLAVAAGRIVACLPPEAIVGRLGGDEFAVLCGPGTTADRASALAAQVVEAMAQPIAHEEGRVVIGATVGVHVGEPGQPAIDVLDLADRALVAAKAGRGGRRSAGDAS